MAFFDVSPIGMQRYLRQDLLNYDGLIIKSPTVPTQSAATIPWALWGSIISFGKALERQKIAIFHALSLFRSNPHTQCDQIGQFIGLWATF